MTSDGRSHRTKRTSYHLEVLKKFERSGLRGTDLSQFGVKPWHMASLRHGKRLYPSTLKLIDSALDKLQTQNPKEPASLTPVSEGKMFDLAFAYFDAVGEIVEILEKQPVAVRAKMIELASKMTLEG